MITRTESTTTRPEPIRVDWRRVGWNDYRIELEQKIEVVDVPVEFGLKSWKSDREKKDRSLDVRGK